MLESEPTVLPTEEPRLKVGYTRGKLILSNGGVDQIKIDLFVSPSENHGRLDWKMREAPGIIESFTLTPLTNRGYNAVESSKAACA